MSVGNKRYWLSQTFGWGAFILMNLFFTFIFGDFHWYILITLGIYLTLGILVTHLMRISIINFDILLKPLKIQISLFLCFTVVFSLILGVSHTLARDFFNLYPSAESKGKNFYEKLFNNTFPSLLLLFIWNCLYFIYHYIEKSRKQQLDTLQLETLVKELELKTIKAHINPHFIFNSLNSIRALIDENPSRARTAITELSNILRSSMQVDKAETVSFEKELSIVKDYLALENMRFEDRLQVEYEIDEDTLDQQVPPMMLQTLVENAIKHGISKHIRGGIIKIISDYKNQYHELAVQNTGSLNGGLNAEARPDDLVGRGFGLSSTQNRLGLLYGDKASFEIKQVSPSIVEARVLIPVQMN